MLELMSFCVLSQHISTFLKAFWVLNEIKFIVSNFEHFQLFGCETFVGYLLFSIYLGLIN